MGESERTGNKGHPATSRHGAPIEITGLLKSTLRWLADLSDRGVFPFAGVKAVGESPRLYCPTLYCINTDLYVSQLMEWRDWSRIENGTIWFNGLLRSLTTFPLVSLAISRSFSERRYTILIGCLILV